MENRSTYNRIPRIPLTEIPWLQSEWNDVKAWAQNDDVFSETARRRPLASSTLATMFGHVHLAASALVRSGAPASSLCAIRDLVQVANFDALVKQRAADTGFKKNYHNYFMAKTLHSSPVGQRLGESRP